MDLFRICEEAMFFHPPNTRKEDKPPFAVCALIAVTESYTVTHDTMICYTPTHANRQAVSRQPGAGGRALSPRGGHAESRIPSLCTHSSTHSPHCHGFLGSDLQSRREAVLTDFRVDYKQKSGRFIGVLSIDRETSQGISPGTGCLLDLSFYLPVSYK